MIKLHVFDRIVSGAKCLALAALPCVACLIGSPFAAQGSDLILNVTHLNISSVSELEGLDVTGDGSLIAGTSPLVMPDLGNGNEGVQSKIPIIVHQEGAGQAFTELPNVAMGPGEATDVAISPDKAWIAAIIRDDDLHKKNQLQISNGHGVTDRYNLPDSADGLSWSPDGRYLVVAGEKYAAVDIFGWSVRGNNARLTLVKRIGMGEFLPFFVGEEARLNDDLEPESVTFNKDGSVVFVSLQEQSSIAVIDLNDTALVNVIHLPFGFLIHDGIDENGDPVFKQVGVEPDGMGMSPDGSFLIAANEADGDYAHVSGISVVDLRGGVKDVPEPVSYCIFDMDPSLLDGTGLDVCPSLPVGVEPTEEESEAIGALPRLDPNNAKIVQRGERMVAAVNIERAPKDEDRGSVLFLDVTGVLEGGTIPVLDRVSVGLQAGARPEGLRSTNDGRLIWVGLQRDNGSITIFELDE